jgi:hypothetical protein
MGRRSDRLGHCEPVSWHQASVALRMLNGGDALIKSCACAGSGSDGPGAASVHHEAQSGAPLRLRRPWRRLRAPRGAVRRAAQAARAHVPPVQVGHSSEDGVVCQTVRRCFGNGGKPVRRGAKEKGAKEDFGLARLSGPQIGRAAERPQPRSLVGDSPLRATVTCRSSRVPTRRCCCFVAR